MTAKEGREIERREIWIERVAAREGREREMEEIEKGER